jgi:hypothetical protein
VRKWLINALLRAFASALPGCGLGAELPSDPAAWEPPLDSARAASMAEADAAPAFDGGAGACLEEPLFEPALTSSAAGARSHLAGQPCIEGCHVVGGSAKKVFAAAGTVHVSATSRAVARAGAVHGVGGTTLPVDLCGNIYATMDALMTEPRYTQPFVQAPTLHRMDKPLSRQTSAGSCNQSGCHDFGAKLRWGIYF